MTATNLGRWAPWYATAAEPQGYGDDTTYVAAAEWLDGLAVEDWGSGYGWFRQFHNGPYLAVDGTPSNWCDRVADLAHYRTTTPGLLLRHVLEHDRRWADILDNAVASFTRRMCIVLFTPAVERTVVLADDVGGLGVPDIAFAGHDITDRLTGCELSVETLATDTAYGIETILRIER